MRMRQSGVSMIELLVAVALGLVVTAGVIQVFIATSQSSRAQQAISRVQESGRFAFEYIKPHIRLANRLSGCISLPDETSYLNTGAAGYDAQIFNFDDVITVWEYQNTAPGDAAVDIPAAPAVAGAARADEWQSPDGGNLPTILADRAIPNSDVIIVRYGTAVPALTACDGNSAADRDITVNYGGDCTTGALNSGLASGDMADLLPQGRIVYATSSCQDADIFQRTEATPTLATVSRETGIGSPGNVAGGNWTTPLDDLLQFYSVSIYAFYIGVNVDGEPALYQMDFGRSGLNAVPEEIVSGVESMQILLGMLDGEVVTYFAADSAEAGVLGSVSVASVNVSLLVRSPNGADAQSASRTVPLGEFTVNSPDDTRIRQVFRTAIMIRNGAVLVI